MICRLIKYIEETLIIVILRENSLGENFRQNLKIMVRDIIQISLTTQLRGLLTHESSNHR